MSDEKIERTLTAQEKEVVEELYRRKAGMFSSPDGKPTHAYVTLTREVTKAHDAVSLGMKIGHGRIQILQPGTTLKIVMVSRFGDCGVTDDLEADNGYFVRFNFDDPAIVDIRWQPTPTKDWNEFLSGMIAKALKDT